MPPHKVLPHRGIILLTFLYKRPDRLWRDQLHIVPESSQQAAPVMGCTARFYDNPAGALRFEEWTQLVP
jgi:hypothetical protein